MTIRRPAFLEIVWAAVGCGLFTSVACHTERPGDVSYAALEHVPFEVIPPARRLPRVATAPVGTPESPPAREDEFVIPLRNGAVDTTESASNAAIDARSGRGLSLIQFSGPPRAAWASEALRVRGLDLVTPLPGHAWLVYTAESARRELLRMKTRGEGLRYVGPYLPTHALHPELQRSDIRDGDDQAVLVTIQVFDHSGASATIEEVRRASTSMLGESRIVPGFRNVQARLPPSAVRRLAERSDVVNIEPLRIPRLMDERQGMIIAGELTPDGSGPLGPGYREWLDSHGLGKPMDLLIDIADSGLDRGSTAAASLHPDLLDDFGGSRVKYAVLVRGRKITDGPGEGRDCGGHGTINATIAAGLGTKIDAASVDEQGFRASLGIAPGVRVGSSRIFTPKWTFPDYGAMIAHAYRKGARISSNSWGDGAPDGRYDAVSQVYDTLVRSPRPDATSGMVICFSAGNAGPDPGTIANLGATAKNTICIGASEGSSVSPKPDGCDVRPGDADNAAEIAFFSSRGPCADGRFKPDLVAPGTFIRGAVSQDACFTGSDICGGAGNDGVAPPDDAFFPPGQKLYSWSSGTSHSCPAGAGAAALVTERLAALGRSSPSPALVKAWLLNSARAIVPDDGLPSNIQGMGRIDLGRASDDVPRVVVDQSSLFKQSGQSVQFLCAITDGSKPVRITLAWTDAPGVPIASKALMNDLDLRVDAGGAAYHGNFFDGEWSAPGGKPDRLNNVESVVLPPHVLNPVLITITAASLIADGVPGNGVMMDQDFALVGYNLFQPQEPVEPLRSPSTPGSLSP